MKLRDVFDVKQIIYPEYYVEGEWLLGGDMYSQEITDDFLALNSLNGNGKTKYQEFLERNYYRPLNNLMGTNDMADKIKPRIAIGTDIDGRRIGMSFSISAFLVIQFLSLQFGSEIDTRLTKEDITVEQVLQVLKEAMRKERKIYQDILNNGRRSEYFDKVCVIYTEMCRQGLFRGNMKVFLDTMIDGLTKRIIASKHFKTFFSKEIDPDELISCFDYDKFCLLVAKSAVDASHATEINSGKLDNCLFPLKFYFDAVEEIRSEHPTYQETIVIPNKGGKGHKVISIDDVYKEYSEMLKNHPECVTVSISTDEMKFLLSSYGFSEEFVENFDVKSKDATILYDILEKIREAKELEVSWEIIPKGKKREVREGSGGGVFQALPEDERVKRMLYSKNYLENSGYLFQLNGRDKFEGYVGYIYPSGTVIFEKYYENASKKNVTKGSATYVMNLTNFIEMSKLSKTEIIEGLKQGTISGVSRIYHGENMNKWRSKVMQAIEGRDYSDEVLEYIETLTATRVIDKKGEKK